MDKMGMDTGNVTIQRVYLTKFVWMVGLFGLCNKDSKSQCHMKEEAVLLQA